MFNIGSSCLFLPLPAARDCSLKLGRRTIYGTGLMAWLLPGLGLVLVLVAVLALAVAIQLHAAAPCCSRENAGASRAANLLVLHFPADKPVGKLLTLSKRPGRDGFTEVLYALAQGDVTVPRGAWLLIEINYQGSNNLSFLEKLPPGAIVGFRSEKFGLTDKQFVSLTGMKYLKVLNLSDVDITDRGLLHIRECAALEEFSLCSSLVTGKGLAVLRDLHDITYLTLDQNRLDDASLANLSGLKKLVSLRIKGANIGDAGLAHVKNMPLLRRMILNGNKRITDASVPTFLSLPKLKRLDLTDCKLSAAGLMQLNKVPDLRSVEFAFHDYSAGQVDQIKRALGSCKVIDGRRSAEPMVIFAPLH